MFTVASGHSSSAQAAAHAGLSILWNALAGTRVIIGTNSIIGTYTTATFNVTGTTTAGLVAGMFINSDGTANGLNPTTEDTISLVSGSTAMVLTPTKPSINGTGVGLNVSNIKGTLTSGDPTVTVVTFRPGSGVSMASIWPGQTIYGSGIPAATTVVSVSGNSILMSANSTRTGQSALIMIGATCTATNNSNSLTNVLSSVIPTIGNRIAFVGFGNLPAGTTITAAPSSLAAYQAGTGTLTISANATATANLNPILVVAP